MFYIKKKAYIINHYKECLLIVFFLFSYGYSKGIYIYNDKSNSVPKTIVLIHIFLDKQFQSTNTDGFKQRENEILDKIKKGLYAKALADAKAMEVEALQTNSDYWVYVSYFYIGFVANCQKEYETALHYFHQIINSKSNSFINDKERVFRVFKNTAEVYKNIKNSDKAILFYKKSLELGDKLINKKSLVPVYINLGGIYSSQSKFADARECYLNGLDLLKGTNDFKVSVIYNNLGNDEYSQGNYSQAITYYMLSIQISEKINDLNGLALSYNNIGNIYTNGLKNPDRALEYYIKSLEIEKKRGNSDGVAWELISIGNTYNSLKKFEEAQKSITNALDIFKINKNMQGIAKSLDHLGTVYTDAGNYKKAIITYTECIELRKKIHDEANLINVYKNIGALYYFQKDNSKALVYFFKALELAQSTKDKNMIYRIYSGIQDAYVGLGQYDKAYKYLKDYSSLKDTLLNATISKQIIDIQEKYEKNKMEQKVALQNLEIKNKSLQRNGILAFLALTILVFSGIVYFIFHKRKSERLLYLRNSQIKEQEIKNLVQQSEIRSMMSMAEGQESERQRISRELHDRVGSMLSLIKLNLSSFNEGNHQSIKENLTLLDNTYQEVRNISHNLHSGLLTRFGLKAALNDLKNTVESNNAMRINLFIHENELLLPKETEVAIFKVLQELVTNALKHAGAKNLDIQINSDEDGIATVMVEDDGKGFDISSENHEGIGLKNIRYRVSAIGGSLEISSSPGKGACFLINIPVAVLEDNNKVS